MVIRTCYAREGYQCILKCFRAKSYDACTPVCSLISEEFLYDEANTLECLV